jgi:hypothetical protein
MRCVAQATVLMVLLGVSGAIAQDTVGGLRAKATQGDYDAQRILAGCLGEEGECPIQPEPDPVQACTWRMVILTSENPRVGEVDGKAYERDCGFQTIGQLEQAAALAEAQRLFSEIYKRDMPVKRLLQTTR